MAGQQANNLFDQIVRISKTYLGPAAERFIYRQIKNHLNKEPENLRMEDMAVLIDWIRISVSFLTEDSTVIEEYVRQLNLLTKDNGYQHETG